MNDQPDIELVKPLIIEMINCKQKCEGIHKDPNGGVIPRGLWLEKLDNESEKICIIVGINPGKARRKKNGEGEIDYYEKNKVNFDTYAKFQKRLHDEKFVFHNNLEKLAKTMKFGYILWTNLCKCENIKTGKLPPIQTFRKCANKFFRKEIEINLFEKATIIASGKQPFEIISYMCPDKFVVGVPHASGSYSKQLFDELFDENKLKKEYEDKIEKEKDTENEYKCVKLYPEKRSTTQSLKTN